MTFSVKPNGHSMGSFGHFPPHVLHFAVGLFLAGLLLFIYFYCRKKIVILRSHGYFCLLQSKRI